MSTSMSVRPAQVMSVGALAVACWAGATWVASGDDGNAAPLERKRAVASGTSTSAAGNWVYKSKSFDVDANSAASGLVKCGKASFKAVGGGVETSTLGLLLNESRPWDGPGGDTRPDNGWSGWVVNRDNFASSFRVYVICSRR